MKCEKIKNGFGGAVKLSYACSMAALLLGNCFCADTVILKDGRVLNGKINSEEEDAIIITTDAGREVVSQDAVREVRREKASKPAKDVAALYTPISQDAEKLAEQAEHEANCGAASESFKYYERAMRLDSSPAIRRRFGAFYFSVAEKIKETYFAEHHASYAALQTAEQGAMKTVFTGMQGKHKKFDPNDPGYQNALNHFQDVYKKISACLPFYDKASENYGALLRASRNGDFDAAAHQALCLTLKEEVNSKARARQLLNSVLNTYKPSGDVEKALYERCRHELEALEK